MENNQQKITMLQDLGMQFATINSKDKIRFGLFKCFCGKEFKARVQQVKHNKTKSCGCLHTFHGLRGHRLYKTWNMMMTRCNNSNHKDYKYYGERGIKVCDRWLNVANFIEDMYPTFTEGMTLDRENNDLGYEPSNCRWTNKTIQARNTKKLYSNNTSGYRGVSFDKRDKVFRTQIKINNKPIHLGWFNTALEGALAYDKYVIENNLEHTTNFKKEIQK